ARKISRTKKWGSAPPSSSSRWLNRHRLLEQVNSQLPTSNSQDPIVRDCRSRGLLGIGRWRLGVDVVSLCAALAITAATGTARQAAPFAADRMGTILYGAAFYPEYTPYERLDRDIALMQQAGISIVRVGESTWTNWEPRDGDFQFTWMQRVL